MVQHVCAVDSREPLLKLEHFDSLLKVKRIIAWLQRSIFNTRNSSKLQGPLSAKELNNAKEYLINEVQMQYYEEKINFLNGKP